MVSVVALQLANVHELSQNKTYNILVDRVTKLERYRAAVDMNCFNTKTSGARVLDKGILDMRACVT